MQVFADDFVGFGGRPGEVALAGILQRPIRQEGEGHHRLVAVLGLHLVKVDGALVQAGGGAGFEPAQLKAQLHQAGGQARGVHQPLRPAVPLVFADNDASLEVHAAGHHHRPAGDSLPGEGGHARHAAVLRFDGHRFALAHLQSGLGHQRPAHAVLIGLLVGLCPQAMHRRALAGVQHPALQKGIVNGAAHLAAQGVQLPHQVSLGRAPNGRVAGHQGHAVHVQGQQQRIHAHARCGQRRLAPRVSPADHHQLRHRHSPLSPLHYSTTPEE